MTDFFSGSEHPFAVHTASSTLLGRSDIHLPGTRSNTRDRGMYRDMYREVLTNDDKSTHEKSKIDSKPSTENVHDDVWVSSPRKNPPYRDTKTSRARTRTGQDLIPPGGNIRPCGRDSVKHKEECVESSNAAIRSADDSSHADAQSPAIIDPAASSVSGSNDSRSVVCIERRIQELWQAMQTSLEGLAARGYDRTLIYSVLPTIQKQVLDTGVSLVYTRLQKRLSDQWKADEPTAVVFLCATFIRSCDELTKLL